jgi:hypothetical protein
MSNTSISSTDFAKFFKELQEMVKDKIPVDSKYKEGDNCCYCYFPTNIKTHFEWYFDKKSKCLKICFHSENASKEENKRFFDVIRHFRDIIEKETGKEVMYEKEYEKKGSWYGIYIEKRNCELNEDLKEWAADKMVIFYNTIKDELEKTSKMLAKFLERCNNE